MNILFWLKSLFSRKKGVEEVDKSTSFVSSSPETPISELQVSDIATADILVELNKLKYELTELKTKTSSALNDFEKLEKRWDRFSTFMMWMMGIIAGVFFVTGILIALDYFKNNEERYEKLIDKTEEMKQDFYTKEQVNNNIISSVTSIENQLDDFKKCLKEGGWNRCF